MPGQPSSWHWGPRSMTEFWFALTWAISGAVIADLGIIGVVAVTSTAGQIMSAAGAWAGIALLFVMVYVRLHDKLKANVPYQELPLTQGIPTELLKE
jgi:hypothetical protein